MRTKDAVKALLSGAVVYVAMAACSAGRSSTGYSSNGTGGAASGGVSMSAGGSTLGGGVDGSGGLGSMMDAMVDAIAEPVPDAEAQTVSGTRLKARYWVGDDGSKQFAGWFDSERNEQCSFRTAEDGDIRCQPVAEATGGVYFAAGCTTPYFYASTGCGVAPKYGSLATGCSIGLFTLTASSPTMVYVGTPANCVSTAVPTGFSFFTGSAIAATLFVKATEQVE